MTTKVYRIPEQYEELVESMRIKIEMLQSELEKRDRLLDEANAQFKCLKSIVEQKIIKIEADFVGRTTFSGMVNKIEEWNKQYEEMRLK